MLLKLKKAITLALTLSMVISVFFAVSTPSTALAALTNPGANLIKDPYFVNGKTDWLASDYAIVTGGNTVTRHDAVSVTPTDLPNPWSASLTPVLNYKDEMTAGDYEITFWAKTSASQTKIDTGLEKLFLNFNSAAASAAVVINTAGWAQYTVDITITDVASFGINILPIDDFQNSVDSYMISDMTLRGDGVAQDQTDPVLPNTLGVNLIKNPYFVGGTTNWYMSGADGGTMNLTENGAAIINPETGSQAVLVVPGGTDTWDRISQSNLTLPNGGSLPPGDYVASYWIKSPCTDSTLYTFLYIGGDAYFGNHVNDLLAHISSFPRDTWVKVTYAFTVTPQDIANGFVDNITIAHCMTGGANAGPYYISDVTLQGYGIAMPGAVPFTVTGVQVFADHTVNYGPISPMVLTVTNTGDTGLTGLKVQLSGADAGGFAVDTAGMQTSLAGNGLTTFTIAPVTGLQPNGSSSRTYTAKATISVDGYDSTDVSLSFTVWPAAAETTYYVDGTAGNDANSGLSGSPWKTIAKAADTLIAGDTVIVEAGTYRDEVRPLNSGRVDAPITYNANGNVILTGSDVFSDNSANGWTDKGNNIWSFTYPEILQFKMTSSDASDSNPYEAARREMVIIDGKVCATPLGTAKIAKRSGLQTVLDSLQPGDIYSDGNTCPDLVGTYGEIAAPTVYVKFPAGKTPANTEVEYGTSRVQLYVDGVSYVVMDGFTFTHNTNSYTSINGGFMAFNGANNTLRNCVFEWNNFAGIASNGKNDLLQGIVARDNGGIGMTAFGNNCYYKDIQLLDNNWKGYAAGNHAGGCKVVGAVNTTFDGIISSGNEGPGLWFDIFNSNDTVKNCALTDNLFVGLMLEYHSDYISAYNNVISNNRGMGIFVSSSNNESILNNTVYDNQREGIKLLFDTRGGIGNCMIYNNIFCNDGKVGGENEVSIMGETQAETATTMLDGNVYWKDNLTNMLYAGSGRGLIVKTNSITTWKDILAQQFPLLSATSGGYDAHSRIADPMLENESSADGWRLTVSSPARKAGVQTPPGAVAVSTDKDGVHSRPADYSYTDAGAYQLSTADDGYNNPGSGLSDTRDDLVLGPNLIKNPYFQNGTTYWHSISLAQVTLLIGAGAAAGNSAVQITPAASASSGFGQTVSLPGGADPLPAGDYELSIRLKSDASAADLATGNVKFNINMGSGNTIAPVSVTDSVWHTYKTNFSLAVPATEFIVTQLMGGVPVGAYEISDVVLRGLGVGTTVKEGAPAIGDLLGYWNFESSTIIADSVAADSSPNHNDGQIFSANGLAVSTAEGVFGGQALQFNEGNTKTGWILVPDSVSLDPVKQVTVACWAKIDKPNGYNKAVWNGTDTGVPYGAYGLELLEYKTEPGTNTKIDGSDGRCVALNVGTQDDGSVKAPTYGVRDQYYYIPDTDWHQITGTYDGQYVKMYVDGVLVGSTPATGDMIYENMGLAIGGAVNKPTFIGAIDDVQVYGRALTPDEITYLQTNPVLPVTGAEAANTVMDSNGGDNIITVLGLPLPSDEDITVGAFDGNGKLMDSASATTGGSVGQLPVTLSFPANASATDDAVYSIKVSRDGGETWGSTTATVTVSKVGGIAVTTYDVSFYSADGSYIAGITGVVSGSKIAKPDDPVRNGYVFGGWYRDADYTTPWYFNNDTVVGNTELYAKWAAVPVTDKSALADLLAQAAALDRNIYTAESLGVLDSAVKNGQAVMDDPNATNEDCVAACTALQAALDNMSQAQLICNVKSMLAKVAKLQAIPYTWNGVGTLEFKTSNPAVCNVTQSGTLVPLKAGIAVITIAVNGTIKSVFAVTVTV